MIINSLVLVDFSEGNSAWRVVDDGVMGGKSAGNFYVNEDRHGVFEGKVSLENNGGFSSVMHRFEPSVEVGGKKKVVLHLKGDGKRYQFRLKESFWQPHSHIHYFKTTGDWQKIELPLNDFYATFRGRTLDLPNFQAGKIEEVRFLIANKKAEVFKLEIKRIWLE